jgi:hypothetical protein
MFEASAVNHLLVAVLHSTPALPSPASPTISQPRCYSPEPSPSSITDAQKLGHRRSCHGSYSASRPISSAIKASDSKSLLQAPRQPTEVTRRNRRRVPARADLHHVALLPPLSTIRRAVAISSKPKTWVAPHPTQPPRNRSTLSS